MINIIISYDSIVKELGKVIINLDAEVHKGFEVKDFIEEAMLRKLEALDL